jgi:hypothetical protein
MPRHKRTRADAVSALFESADGVMNLAAELFCHRFQRHELLNPDFPDGFVVSA